jgi:cysteine desulfurase/selenocysteine lyase
MNASSLARQQQPAAQAEPTGFDLARVRFEFPILRAQVNGRPLAYLDNGASSQMPQPVIDRLIRYRTSEHCHRRVRGRSPQGAEVHQRR